jgi:potassium channel subfamily K
MVVPSFYQKGASVADVHHRRRNKLTTSPASEDEKGGTQAEENVFQEDKSQMNSSLVEYDLSKLDPYLNPIQKGKNNKTKVRPGQKGHPFLATSKREVEQLLKSKVMKDIREGIVGRLLIAACVVDESKRRTSEAQDEEQGLGNTYFNPFPIGNPSMDSDINTTHDTMEVYSDDSNHKKMRLYIEIEKCVDLRLSLTSKSNLASLGGRINPMVVAKVNGHEVARTPAIQKTENPVWFDEVFSFPICEKCDYLSFEVWNVCADKLVVNNFIGKCSVDLSSFIEDIRGDETFYEYVMELKRVKRVEESKALCDCPGLMHLENTFSDAIGAAANLVIPDSQTSEHGNESNTIVRTGKMASFRQKRLKATLSLVKPSRRSSAIHFKLTENPQPYRRRDIREAKLNEDLEPFYKSTVFKAFAMIACCMVVGVIGFHFCVEKWSVRDALYFSIVSFTTVGYGDISPKSDAGKLFNCFFAVMGIIIIGISLGYIGQHFVQVQLNALTKDEGEDSDEESVEVKKPSGILSFFYAILPTIVTVALGAVVIGMIEGWSWIDSLYWCIITTSTVGYGDLSPSGTTSRWVAIFFIPIGVAVVSAAIGNVANTFVEAEVEKANKKFLRREVTLRDLEKMNADGDGEVSMLEFVEHMLLAMGKVDKTMLDELHAQFNRLDADGSGGLQQDDLEILTERKLSEQRAMMLEKYSQSILQIKNTPPKKSPTNR